MAAAVASVLWLGVLGYTGVRAHREVVSLYVHGDEWSTGLTYWVVLGVGGLIGVLIS